MKKLILLIPLLYYSCTDNTEIDEIIGDWEWKQQNATQFEKEIIINEQTYTLPESTFTNISDTKNNRVLTYNIDNTFTMTGKMDGEDFYSNGIWTKNDSIIIITEETFGNINNLDSVNNIIIWNYFLLVDTLKLNISNSEGIIENIYERK